MTMEEERAAVAVRLTALIGADETPEIPKEVIP